VTGASRHAALYRGAARVIREGGLAKGTFTDGESHCTVGALDVAAIKQGLPSVRYRDPGQVLPHLADVLGYTPTVECSCGDPACTLRDAAFVAITQWNDQPGTTERDVITLLEQAAEKLEADL
jgi:hypothetical protein